MDCVNLAFWLVKSSLLLKCRRVNYVMSQRQWTKKQQQQQKTKRLHLSASARVNSDKVLRILVTLLGCGSSSTSLFLQHFYCVTIRVLPNGIYLLRKYCYNHHREYRMAFDAAKILIGRDRHKKVLWNLMARITAKSGDSRHHRYILRLLIKHPHELPLVLFSGHNAAVSASYRFAIGELVPDKVQPPFQVLLLARHAMFSCMTLGTFVLALRPFMLEM